MHLLLFIALLVAILPIQAQNHVTIHPYEVYLERGVDGTNVDRIIFMNLITGDLSDARVTGERYMPIGDDIVYFDYVTRQVMMVSTDGVPRPHPFIQIDGSARRIDWVYSRSGRKLAWTVTSGTTDALSTRTFIANVDGTGQQEILQDGPRAGLRALPVAFRSDNSALIMDNHPDGLERFTAYTQYAGLFEVNIETGEIASLPGEPACFCGAGIRTDQLIRLTLNTAVSGFDVRVTDLDSDFQQTIPAERSNYTLAGDVLISPDGTRAVYALSNVSNFGTVNQQVQTVFMLINLQNFTQQSLTEPITTYVHPMRWTEDNTAILFTSPQRNGTWKIGLNDGRLVKVADASYIGTLRD